MSQDKLDCFPCVQVTRDGRVIGTFVFYEISDRIADKSIFPSDLYLNQYTQQWEPISSLRDTELSRQVKWYRDTDIGSRILAAKSGDQSALFFIADIYLGIEEWRDTTFDDHEARRMCLDSIGVPEIELFNWMIKAAENGHEVASYWLINSSDKKECKIGRRILALNSKSVLHSDSLEVMTLMAAEDGSYIEEYGWTLIQLAVKYSQRIALEEYESDSQGLIEDLERIRLKLDDDQFIQAVDFAFAQDLQPASYKQEIHLSLLTDELVDDRRLDLALWCTKKAAQGVSIAQYKLGFMLKHGDGYASPWPERWSASSKLKFTESISWFFKSAQQGLQFAQVELADSYLKGCGVKKDLIESYAYWFISGAPKCPIEVGIRRALENPEGSSYEMRQIIAATFADDYEAFKAKAIRRAEELKLEFSLNSSSGQAGK
jgi:TPR repeat protein